jgi:F-type H+-transporting ATPase subunit delta
LFEAAQEKGNLDEVLAEAQQLSAAVGEVEELRQLLDNPEVESTTKGDILARVAQGADELIVNFVRVLAEKGRAAELPQIVDELNTLVAVENKVLDVELTTAHELSDAEFQRILQKIEKSAGRKVQASRSVDPDLIGGIVLQAGSMRLDASVRGRLERLRQELATARS